MEIEVGFIVAGAATIIGTALGIAWRLLLARLTKVERSIEAGVLPRADERLRALEQRVEELCKKDEP